MAFFRGDIYSYELDKMTSLNVYLPHDDLARCQITKPMSTLILLHGLQGNNSFWTRYSSVERYAQEHNIALVIPEAEMSLYADMRCGLAYGRYIGEELKQIVQAMFRIPTDREHYGIAGFSMGGREALAIGILRPDLFGYVGSIAAAPGLVPGKDWAMEHPGQFREEQLSYKNDTPFLIMVCCGDSDKTVGTFPHSYHKILTKNGVEHIWWEIPGSDHGDPAISSGIYNFVKFLF